MLERDEFTCRDCGCTDKTLHVHHCAYPGRHPWDADKAILLTLCHDCHEKRQGIEDAVHAMLGEILAKTGNSKDEASCFGEYHLTHLELLSYEFNYAKNENERLTIITSSSFLWHQKELERLQTELRATNGGVT